MLMFMSIFASSFVLTSCLVDISANETKDTTIAGIRDECSRVQEKYGSLSSSNAIGELFRIDSTLKESMRLSVFAVTSLTRIIPKGSGLDLGNGIHLPGDSRVCVPSRDIQRDPAYYENPLQFDAFRFSRPFENSTEAGVQDAARKLCVTVNESFLVFGYGKHSCPGRWFASQMLKQALAYIVQNYEIEYIGTPPPPKGMWHLIPPPTEAQVRVRRRV